MYDDQESFDGIEQQVPEPVDVTEEQDESPTFITIENSTPQLSPAEEARTVIDLEEDFYHSSGDKATSYLVHAGWWRQWCAYSGLEVLDGKQALVKTFDNEAVRPARPHDIDNTALVNEEGALRPELQERKDYVLRGENTWRALQKWYPSSSPALPVETTFSGEPPNRKMSADLYPLCVKVIRSSDPCNGKTISISKQASLADLKQKACAAMGVEEVDVQMWDYYSGSPYGAVLDSKLDEDLETAKIIDTQDILLQEKVDGSFPELSTAQPSTSFSSPIPLNSTRYGSINRFSEDTINEEPGAQRGVAGLGNLGNTCFMNSSIQCLAHTVPLMRVFLGEAYKADLNRDNPLGNKGELAEAFGALMEKLWQGGVRSVAPRRFKQQLATFAPQFGGYSQQDSQELLAFLLDGLHEDLNRIKNKPYIEEADSDGRPDAEVALEAWRNYRARNDSVVVDHFQGLYKSTVVCPDCGYHSVKFDPFMYLSLPLPVEKIRLLDVTVVCMDGSAAPTQYTLEVPKTGVVGDVYKALGKVCGIQNKPETVLALVDVFNGRVHEKFYKLDQPMTDLRNNVTLVAYRYPSAELGPESGFKELHIFQRRVRKRSTFSFSMDSHETFAAPLLLWLPADTLQDLSTQEAGSQFTSREVVVSQESQLGTAVEAALRPFKRARVEKASPLPNGSAAYDDTAGKGEGAPSPPDTDEPALTAQAQNMPSDTESTERVEAMPAAQQSSDGEDGPPLLAGGDEDAGVIGMAGAISISPRETPEASPNISPQDSPPGTPRADSGLSASSFQNPLPPFDMFERQQQHEEGSSDAGPAEPADDSVSAADTHTAPYRIKLATSSGSTSVSSFSSSSGSQLYFAIEWASDGGGQYEPERMEQPEVDSSAREVQARHAGGPKPLDVDECISAFLEGERLEQADSWYCKRCKAQVQAHKKLDLWSLPEVLVIHLKRFSFSRHWRDKIDTLVKFPLEGLDLSDALLRPQDVPPIYDLYAVSNHMGSMSGGHYTAYAKMNDDGQWYGFDDSHAYKVEPAAVQSSSAYLLFYRRREEAQREHGLPLDALTAQAPTAAIASSANVRSGTAMPNSNGHLSLEEKMAEAGSAPSKAQPESKASGKAATTTLSAFPGPKSLALPTPSDIGNTIAAAGFQKSVEDMEIDAWQHQLP